jgi:hypothetical protein
MQKTLCKVYAFSGLGLGPANAARNEETQPDFLPALKRQYKLDQQQ